MLFSAAALIPPSSSALLRPRLPVSLPGPPNLAVVRRPDGNLGLARWRCHAISKRSAQENGANLVQDGVPVIRRREKVPESNDEDQVPEDMRGMINGVKSMLSSTDDDGEISISAYDTAWVALVKHQNGSGDPQFPSSLQWIVQNQLPDGSWGEYSIFLAHDRIINTLACVVTLKSWSIHADICERGISFLRDNMWRLAQEEAELMPIGFEIAFPSLLEIAKALGLELPYDDPALQDIYASRNLKLKRIPNDVLHKLPTSLLYSLEGMPGLDWEKLFGLQCVDGSFLTSPASTAYALMQTKDEKCLKYLQKIVERFDGGVPNVYPVDLFDRMWAVDRLERLGISRYFEPEIKQCLDFVYRYWTEEGIGWTRNSTVPDVDCTAMGFRLLRLHGYHVSPDVFKHFEKEGGFFCCAGQSSQAVTGMYSLNRASQVAFPGDRILEQAKDFSYKFLREKQAANQLRDKWIITKDLPGEVGYALDFPWYASLPRIETRLYIEHYGGADVVWIGKTLYRMPRVNNDVYLELAKSDFNRCQALHQVEWEGLQKWCEESGLAKHGVRAGGALTAYFLAAACIFEPDRAAERLAWARTAIVADAISSYFRNESCSVEMRQAFIHDFLDGGRNDQSTTRLGWKRSGLESQEEVVGPILLQLHDRIASDALSANQGNHVVHHLREAWAEWLLTWKHKNEGTHVREETGLLLVRTVEICASQSSSVEPAMAGSEFDWLARLTSSVCRRLQHRMLLQQGTPKNLATSEEDKTIEAEMQELAQCVLQRSPSLSSQTKQTFLTVAKSFYYAAHCPSAALNHHISKVLFEPVAQSGCK
ncbi:ent-copalyl diphosphate synthase 1, chloroplastic-like [Phoenix dactylifera]|uniref:Ent-copalyl diphosphate synthase 1, chloroplastic-like n=1 Tax=Phoenix dactylifera TaxID=42345 RepID=A0A8B8ZIU5_PHODC|nr:ent-copalyl diphosphate synthase 1, chloroplastic-like [Phoenix dactylifera]